MEGTIRTDGFKRGLSYATSGARLLRKHPSLLWVALATGLFNGAAPRLVSYVTYEKTAVGREWVAWVRDASHRRAKTSRAAGVSPLLPYSPAQVVMPAVPSLTAPEVTALAWSELARPGAGQPSPSASAAWSLTRLLDGVLWLAVALLAAGGYLGVASWAALRGELDWARFWPEAKRVFWRFLYLFFICVALVGVATGVALVPTRTHVQAIALSIIILAACVMLFFLSLSQFAVMVDNAPLGNALRQSVVTIRRTLPTALVVIMGAGCLQWLAYLPLARLVMQLQAKGWELSVTSLAAIPISVLSSCAYSAVGAWFCLTALLWYDDALPPMEVGYQQGGTPRQDDVSDDLESRESRVVCGGCGKRLPPGVNVCPDCNAE
jgi:hypothetical protein